MKSPFSAALTAIFCSLTCLSCSSTPTNAPAQNVVAGPPAAPTSVAGKTFVYQPKSHECFLSPDCDNPVHSQPFSLTWHSGNDVEKGNEDDFLGYRYVRKSETEAVVYWCRTLNGRGGDMIFHLHFTSPTSGTVVLETDGGLSLVPMGQSGSGTFTLQ